MGYLKWRIGGIVVFGLLSGAAAHAQATINDCEKIQAADAYNQCLGKFGPSSKVQSLEPEKPSDVKGSSEEAAATAGRPKGRHRRGRAVARRKGGGRKHMAISVGRP